MMNYMSCPACKEQSVPVGGTECEFCDWKSNAVAVDKKNNYRFDDCLECGKNKRIIARGLCGACYPRLKKSGELNSKYPAKNKKKSVVVDDKPLASTTVVPQKTEKINKPAKVTPISAVPSKNPSTEKPKTDNSLRELSVKFFERDRQLLESVVKGAAFGRRSLSQEILFRLEHGLKP